MLPFYRPVEIKERCMKWRERQKRTAAKTTSGEKLLEETINQNPGLQKSPHTLSFTEHSQSTHNKIKVCVSNELTLSLHRKILWAVQLNTQDWNEKKKRSLNSFTGDADLITLTRQKKRSFNQEFFTNAHRTCQILYFWFNICIHWNWVAVMYRKWCDTKIKIRRSAATAVYQIIPAVSGETTWCEMVANKAGVDGGPQFSFSMESIHYNYNKYRSRAY